MSVNLILFDVNGSPLGKEYHYDSPATFLFGRDPTAHHCADDDPVVSRRHYIIEISPPYARLHDLSSRNGVRVNDILHGGKSGLQSANGCVPPIVLYHGDRIRVGKTIVEFQVGAGTEVHRQNATGQSRPDLDVDTQVPTMIVPRFMPTQATASNIPPRNTVANMLAGAFPRDDRTLRIPGYNLNRILGKGGMGVVYLAIHQGGSEAAVKILHPGRKVDGNTLLRFRREIAIARSLFHENIVACFDDGYIDGTLYLVMEYLQHGSLSERLLRSGPFAPESALPYMLQLLNGLAFAHSRNLVHRDVKPANVLFGGKNGDVAKLADFGLAKSYVDAGLSNFTVTGTTAGSVTCLPPEQLMDFKRVRPASDVFSLGATFYEMLAGCSPYNIESGKDGISAILSFNLTPLSRRRPDLPAPLTERIDRAILKDPAKRYHDAAEMLAAFSELV